MSEWNLVYQYWQSKWKQHLRTIFSLQQQRQKQLKQVDLSAKQRQESRKNGQQQIGYQLHTKLLIEDKGTYYHEEVVQDRTAYIENGHVIAEHPNTINKGTGQREIEVTSDFTRFYYDRRAAVQYAERWWNGANPAYPFFEEDDCTNYISQCLRAGGIPMTGMPNRSKGWWYQNDQWSYSWSVAHSFRWYLNGAVAGWNGGEVSQASQLSPGDVICYDFQGDGRWDHNTIVVAKDSQNQPLVNAHTNNSRNRYWTYEDSAAWTPACEYRFFRISD